MRKLLPLLVLLGGCKIADTVYQGPGGDDDGDGPIVDAPIDSPPSGIHVQVTPTMASVAEGGQVTVQVRLSEAPAAERTIEVQGGALTPTPATLTFTPENWNVNRTVILAAGQDDDAVDSPVTVIFFGQGLVDDGTAMIMITDDDTLSLFVSPATSIGVTEGGMGPVTVSLTAQPTSNLAIAVSTTSSAVATASTAQLMFTTMNWATPQTIMVTGVEDLDTGDNTTELIFDPVPEGVPGHTVQVNVTDNDVVAFDVSPTSLTLTEAAGVNHQGTIMVRLTRPPVGTLTVTVDDAPGGKVALGTTSLDFDAGNYNVFQPVSVTALDDTDVSNEAITVTLSAPMVADRDVQVAVTDDDIQVIEVTPGTVADLDEGAFTNLGVRLRYQPAGPVLVDIDSGDPARLSPGTNQITFTPTDYATPQQVRVTALEDEDLANQTVTMSFNSSALGLTTNVPVTIDDQDMQDILLLPTALSLNEGMAGSFTVRLAYQPAGNVAVTVAPDNADLMVAPTSITFAPGDYNQPRTVTVTAQQDPDTVNETHNVLVSSPGLSTRSVAVAVADDDALDIIVMPTSIFLAEGDAQGQVLMVSLGAAPAGNLIVNLTTNPAGVATLSVNQLTFTSTNYNMPQGVRVTGTQDPDGLDETTTITLSATGLDDKTVPVSVTDDDTITAVFSQNPILIAEGKPDSRLTVQLNVDPGRAITVNAVVTTPGPLDFEVNPAQYNFNSSNWNQPQTVTLHALADDTDDDETEFVQFQIAGEANATLTVNTDDPTILVGFPPPHQSPPSVTIMQLEGYSDGVVPSCWVLEKLRVDIATVPGNGSIKVGLYADGLGKPGNIIWEDNPRTVVQGVNSWDINLPINYLAGNVPAWIVVEATTGVTFRSKAGSTTRCRVFHMFGSFFPNPFDGTVVQPPIDGGSSFDSGTGAMCASGQVPPAIWLIGRPPDGCVDPT